MTGAKKRSISIGLASVVLLGCGETKPPQASTGPPTLAIRAAAGATPTAPAVEAPELTLRLQVGMRFPLLKTVRQSVLQTGATGGAAVAGFSELELATAVAVEQVDDSGCLLGVRVDRVRYRQDVTGQRFEFDSDQPTDRPSAEAAVYSGMVGRGFTLRVGTDNRIAETIGYDAFLESCLRDVPPAERDRVASRLAQTSGDENLANFVDDGIALLPMRANHGATAAVGDRWRRERRVVRPVRLFVTEDCTLAGLTPTTAEVDVTGTIAAGRAFDSAEVLARDVEVRVRGGHSFGHCRFDRATGLPIESEIERLVEMRVRTPDGRQLDQTKRVVTTIRTFPPQRNAPER